MSNRHDFLKLSAVAAAGLLLGSGSAAAQVGKIPDGLTRIFDGKTTKGWHVSRTTRHGTTPNVFVENGELVLKQRPFGQGGLVFTDKAYHNFDLYVEVKAAWGCNSGIFLRSTEEGSAYQIELDQTRGTGALLGEGMRVSVGARPTEAVNRVWRIDDWNSFRIRMEGDAPHITEWINGDQMFDVQEPVNDKIAGKTAGLIGLQLHYGTVYDPAVAATMNFWSSWKPDAAYRFRNIAIKELP
jgi:hypothetical protein